jgi:hypothetical protein
MDAWSDLENIMTSLSDGSTKVASGAINLAQTMVGQLPSMRDIKAKIYNAFEHNEKGASAPKRPLAYNGMKVKGDFNKRMIPANVQILVICLVVVLCSCVLAKIIMVPMTQSSNEEVNARKFRYRTSKNEYIMYKSEE